MRQLVQRAAFCGLLLALLAPGSTQDAAPRFEDLAQHFDYDREDPADLKQYGADERGGVWIYEVSYLSLRGGRVPATVVAPRGKGPFPAILWGHWMMPGSPLRNRKEFLDEAELLARSGAVSLLIDAPLVRPGVVEDPDPMSTQPIYATQQAVVDFRRGLDVLLERYKADPQRIAYVGHSFNAHAGAILVAVDKRITAAVLMAGGYADEEYVFTSGDPKMLTIRERYGDDKVRQFLRKFEWDDPVYFLSHSSPAHVFLQFGNQDPPLNGDLARHYFKRFGEPKNLGFYDAGHALNAQARRERVDFLVQQLKLRPVDPRALEKIPELK